MNAEMFVSILLGLWRAMHAAAKNEWAPFSIACGVIAFACVSLWVILPFGWEVLPCGGPLLASAVLIAWALFWPLKDRTWFGCFWLLPRMILALFIANLTWAVTAVLVWLHYL